jgi:hypothetical protein
VVRWPLFQRLLAETWVPKLREGSDIRCQIGSYSFAEVQAVSYSVTREKAPIYTLGTADPRSFSRTQRGIAGSLIWVNFDRHALLDIIW